MNDQELNKLLMKIQLLDNRQVDKGTFLAWREVIGHLYYDDANQAIIDHFRETPAYLMPAHIVARATAIRRRYIETNFNMLHEAGHTPGAPRPHNEESMARAWKDPARFAIEVAVYHQQLRDEGLADLLPLERKAS